MIKILGVIGALPRRLFNAWRFTGLEREIVSLLIKDLSIPKAAEVRGTKPGNIKS